MFQQRCHHNTYKLFVFLYFMKYLLPALGYSFDALEPFIDAKTMEIHWGKHHQTYVDKLNAALEKYSDLQEKKVEELLIDLSKIPEDIRTAVRNHGGGHWNHSFFWPLLKKDVKCEGVVLEMINESFTSIDAFKAQFSNAATGLFGSGWVWLVLNNGKFEIMTTPNQDTPMSAGKVPVLGLDLWEHSYYIKYQNRRADYVAAWWNVVNWDKVEENLRVVK